MSYKSERILSLEDGGGNSNGDSEAVSLLPYYLVYICTCSSYREEAILIDTISFLFV